MSRIKYVSVHERDDGIRRIRPGKRDRTHGTISIPKPDNDLESMETHEWERVAAFPLPESMPKSEFPDWWNENLRSEDEPEVIDQVLRLMGERGDDPNA